MIDAAIVALVPVVLLLPWSIALATHPSQLLLEAGLQPPGLASPHLAARSLMLLSPGGPGLPPFWVTAGLVLAAAVALVASGRRALVVAGWAAALLGLLAAAALSKFIVTPAVGGDPVLAWPGPALVFAGAGLLLAVAACGDLFQGKLGSGGWRAPSGIALVALAAVACTAPALAAAAWVTSGVRGPVAPSAGPVLPEFVSVSSATGLRLRTLVLRVDPRGRVAYSVLRDTDPLIGASELAVPPAAQRALNLSVATLTAPYGGYVQDQGRSLSQLGIGYVLLPAPINPPLARLLDGVPGLRPVSQTAAFALWRVSDTTARVRVVEQTGTVVPVNSGPVRVAGASVPAAGGTLVLAEPAGGWSAALNGQPLIPLAAPVGGWAQGFRLPPGGGSLTVSHSQLSRIAAVALEALAVAIVLALGLPGARVAGEAEAGAAAAAAARRSSRDRDTAGDHVRDRKPPRRGKGKPASPARPRVRRPPVPVADEAGEAAAAGARGTAPAGVREAAAAGVRGTAAAGVRGAPPWPDEPAATGSFPGDLAADSPTMVSHARGGTDVPSRGARRPSAGGRGMPADPGGLPPRGGRGTEPGRSRWPGRRAPDRPAQPDYQPGPGDRAVRPGPEPAGSPGRPSYDSTAGRGRPGYDTGPGRAVPPGPEPGGGRSGGPGYDAGPGRAVPPGPDQGSGGGRRGYDTGPGRPHGPGTTQIPIVADGAATSPGPIVPGRPVGPRQAGMAGRGMTPRQAAAAAPGMTRRQVVAAGRATARPRAPMAGRGMTRRRATGGGAASLSRTVAGRPAARSRVAPAGAGMTRPRAAAPGMTRPPAVVGGPDMTRGQVVAAGRALARRRAAGGGAASPSRIVARRATPRAGQGGRLRPAARAAS